MANSNDSRIRVCILIAVYNEQESLALLAPRLQLLHEALAAKYQVDYCFVDDGSTDQTPALLPSAVPCGASFSVHRHLRNRGIGAAFRTGFSSIQADVVCTLDADCSYAPQRLEGMIDTIVSRKADVVVASPYHPDGGVEGVQRWRILISRQCSRLYRVVTPLKLHTFTSMFRAYRGPLARAVRFPSDGFVSTVEILLDAARRGARIEEMPIVLRKRSCGHSKMKLLRTVRSHLLLIGKCLEARRDKGFPDFAVSMAAQHEPAVAKVVPIWESLAERPIAAGQSWRSDT